MNVPGVRGTLRNALLGAAVAAVFLSLLSGASEVGLRSQKWGGLPMQRGYPPGYFTHDAFGFAKPAPGQWHVVTTSAENGDLLYDVHYTVDRFGRRVTPVSDETRSRDRFAMVFGCSYAYGEGVQDDETLAHDIGELAPAYRPYNYAFHGGGPFEALARVEHVDFDAEVAEKSGVAFYVFIDDHVNRVINASNVASWHSNEVHYARRPDGTFVHDGTFHQVEPWRTRLAQFVFSSRVLRYIGVQMPMKVTPEHVQLTIDALGAVAKRFGARFPGSQFYVVIYPGSQWHAELVKGLGKLGVRTLDYHDLFKREDPRYHLGEDRHPSAEAHRTLAAAIVRDLDLDGDARPLLTAATSSPPAR